MLSGRFPLARELQRRLEEERGERLPTGDEHVIVEEYNVEGEVAEGDRAEE